MQLCCLEGVQNLVAIIIQLSVGRISQGGVRVQVLEEIGEFGSLVQFSAGV